MAAHESGMVPLIWVSSRYLSLLLRLFLYENVELTCFLLLSWMTKKMVVFRSLSSSGCHFVFCMLALLENGFLSLTGRSEKSLMTMSCEECLSDRFGQCTLSPMSEVALRVTFKSGLTEFVDLSLCWSFLELFLSACCRVISWRVVSFWCISISRPNKYNMEGKVAQVSGMLPVKLFPYTRLNTSG